MTHKVFISYKYRESIRLRDEIVERLGDNAVYYTGKTSPCPSLDDEVTNNIKKSLKHMISHTKVCVVIISPTMKKSKWIEWEIEYCLNKKHSQGLAKGVVAVIMKHNGGYDWFLSRKTDCHGRNVISYNNDFLYPIIYNNHFNARPPVFHCEDCQTYDQMDSSYISYVKEEHFLISPTFYINDAYEKSKNTNKYELFLNR